MTIEELFNLPRKKESLKKIDNFIAASSVDELCHHQALCIKALTLHEIGKTNDALKLILPKEAEFDSMDNDTVVCYTDTLKEIFISIEQFDKALHYIQIKKLHLSLMAHDVYKKDMILYHIAQGHILEAKRWLILFLEDDISDYDRIFAYEKLIEFQYEEKDIISFNQSYDKLLDYYQEYQEEEKITKLDIMRANILIHENKTDEALDFIKSLLETKTIDDNSKIELATIIINILIEKNELKKASIADSNYSELARSVKPTIKIAYFNTSKKLYTLLNNRFSIDFADSEIEHATLELAKEQKASANVNTAVSRKEKRTQVLAPIVIEKVIKEEVKHDSKLEVTYKAVKTEEVEVSELYSNLSDLIDMINQLSDTYPLREILRQSFIEITKKINFSEVVIILKQDEDFTGYHYKMERLYDKKFKMVQIEKSIAYRSLISGHEIVSSNALSGYYNISPITGNVTEFSHQAALPLYFDGNVIGSITFMASDNEMLSGLGFETLKLISMIINTKVDRIYFDDKNRKKYEDISFISDNMPYGIMTITDDETKLNHKALEMLEFSDDTLTIDEFMEFILPSDRITYKNALNRLISGQTKAEMIMYHLTDKTAIREYLYIKELTDHYKIVGLLIDRTIDEHMINEYKKTAEEDSFTRLKSLNHLKDTLETLYLDRKFSFVLLDAKHFKLYKDVYGQAFARDLILAIGLKLKKILQDYDGYAYHYDSDQFIILLKNNDERKAKRLVLEILNKLSNQISDINKRVNITFNAAIYRINKSSKVLSLDEFIDALSNTLVSMKDLNDTSNQTMYHNSEESKEKFYEFQLELHISEAIDNGKLSVCYKQMADIDNNNLYGYESIINLDSIVIDSKHFENIIEKRHLEEMCDKYLITHTIMELHDFYKNFGGYFKVFMKVHSSTLLSKGFIQFLEQNLKYFKVPSSLIAFEVVVNTDKSINKVCNALNKMNILVGSSNLQSVLENNLTLYFANYQTFGIDKLKQIKEFVSQNDTLLVVTDVKEKSEFLALRQNGFRVVKGDVLPKVVKITDIMKVLSK